MDYDSATVIVCSRNRGPQLRTALPAIVASLRSDDEVLVVDSYSATTETMSVAREFGAQCVRASRPGLSHARNVGIANAHTPIVLFTDDDCEPDADWVRVMLSLFVDKGIGFATGQVVAKGSGGRLGTTTSYEAGAYSVFNKDSPINVMGHGANMAFRRDALLDIGGFDEWLGAGASLRSAEDWDAFARLTRRGWSGVYEPSAVVAHEQWRDEVAALKTRYGYSKGAAALAIKAHRLGDERGRPLLIQRAMNQGIKRCFRRARRLDYWGTAEALGTLCGCIVGAWHGGRLPLDGEFFGRRPATLTNAVGG